jgi:hypothetical protein
VVHQSLGDDVLRNELKRKSFGNWNDLESGPTRLIRITTKEVTDPDVAVSFDGKWLIFTALGHLFIGSAL